MKLAQAQDLSGLTAEACSHHGPADTAANIDLVCCAGRACGTAIRARVPENHVLTIDTDTASLRVPVTFAAVLVALALTGALSARLADSNVRRAVLRVVIGGALGLAFTYGIGHLFGTAIS